jgi:Family of unknown function (DUF5695)
MKASWIFDTPEFALSLVKSSQTVAALKPKGTEGFDFTPGDLLVARSQNCYFHLGDLTLRIRTNDSEPWANYSTAASRRPVRTLPASGETLASADLAATLPSDIPLEILRIWAVDQGKLVLRFTLTNTSAKAVEVGALALPMVFNNVLNDRSLEQAHAICSFYDPYIGEDAGYLQVTRLNGHGPALLVVPDGKTPLEAYNPILDRKGRLGAAPVFTDPTPRGITFEGFYEWMVHSKAYAEIEWQNAQPWNPPTSIELRPGESRSYGLKFVVSDSIRHIERLFRTIIGRLLWAFPDTYSLKTWKDGCSSTTAHLSHQSRLSRSRQLMCMKMHPPATVKEPSHFEERHGAAPA